MGRANRLQLGLFGIVVLAVPSLAADEPKKKPLAMTPAVACVSIEGYEQYNPLVEALATEDDKLLLYYRPLNYRVDRDGAEYRASLSIDGQVRKKGEKSVLRRKVDVIKYDPKFKTKTAYLYFSHSASLKGLAPGEYELEIILHDRLDPGATATQRVPFRIKANDATKNPPKDETKKGN